jgi:hypothetical protein
MSEGNGGTPRLIDLLLASSSLARIKRTVLGQELYIRPLTRQQIADAVPKDKVQRPPDTDALFLLVASAEYEDGTKAFRMDEIEKLRTGLPGWKVQELVDAVMAVQYPSEKEAEQELKENPPSTTE